MIKLIVNAFMNFFNVSISELPKEAIKIQFYVNLMKIFNIFFTCAHEKKREEEEKGKRLVKRI